MSHGLQACEYRRVSDPDVLRVQPEVCKEVVNLSRQMQPAKPRAGPSARNGLLLTADNENRPVAEIALRARLAAPGSSPLRLTRLVALPALAPTSVKDDFDLRVPGEIVRQIAPKVGLLCCHDEQVSDRGGDQQRGSPLGKIRESSDRSEGSPSGLTPGRWGAPAHHSSEGLLHLRQGPSDVKPFEGGARVGPARGVPE